MIWLLLAWIVGGVVGWLLYRAIIDDGGELIALAVGGATGWAIGGFFTAVALRSENVFPSGITYSGLPCLDDWGMVGWIFSGGQQRIRSLDRLAIGWASVGSSAGLSHLADQGG